MLTKLSRTQLKKKDLLHTIMNLVKLQQNATQWILSFLEVV